jgi:Holliday junction resolvase RusA-like endonuclease
MIEFTVYGIAQTAGSKRAFPFHRKDGTIGVNVTDDNPKGKSWKHQVANAAFETWNGPLLDGPLSVRMMFYMPRLKSHFGTGRNATLLKASAPTWHIVKPDSQKLARCLVDALTGVVWRDDAQISHEESFKFYGEPSRVEIQIKELPCPNNTTKS